MLTKHGGSRKSHRQTLRRYRFLPLDAGKLIYTSMESPGIGISKCTSVSSVGTWGVKSRVARVGRHLLRLSGIEEPIRHDWRQLDEIELPLRCQRLQVHCIQCQSLCEDGHGALWLHVGTYVSHMVPTGIYSCIALAIAAEHIQ